MKCVLSADQVTPAMLHELHIRSFAIIDDLHIQFGPGLNVLTGETGAGKSIIIDALGLLLGDRANADWVRSGREVAEIEATFRLGSASSSPDEKKTVADAVDYNLEDVGLQIYQILDEGGLDDPDNRGWLTLSREVRVTGRNVCRVNGRAVSVQVLSEIASLLVDVHGQGEHLTLLQPKTHVNLLDRYAGLFPLRRKIAALVSQLRRVRAELSELNQDERMIAQRIDMLAFQVDEIRQAELKPNEDVALENERRRLSNAETLLSLAHGARALISEEGDQESPCALDLLGEAFSRVEKLARIDPEMDSLAVDSQSLLEQLNEVARGLEDYAETLEFDPYRLQEVEDRINLLENLKRKYGDTIEHVIEFGAGAEEELDELENWEGKTEALEAKETDLLHQIGELGADLSAKRQVAGAKLARQIEGELAELKLEKTRCGVAVEQVESSNGAFHPDGRRVNFDTTGIDRIELLLSTNPGEPLRPVARIASGGETARIMLAIKSVLASADATPTLIFDEIDQGIGGRVGAVVGQKLWALTNGTPDRMLTKRSSKRKAASSSETTPKQTGHQVLCITHLPQLAAYGDQHFTVNKQVLAVNGQERTSTVVSRLDGESQIAELMQMLGATTKAGRQSVEEMLAAVARTKGKTNT